MIEGVLGTLTALATVLLSAEPLQTTSIEANVAKDLSSIELRLTTLSTRSPTLIGLAIQRYETPVNSDDFDSVDPVVIRQFYPYGFSRGTYDYLYIRVNGKLCVSQEGKLVHDILVLSCSGMGRVEVDARIKVPERTGPFGYIGDQLSLAGAWYPQVLGAPRDYRLKLTVPSKSQLMSPRSEPQMLHEDSGVYELAIRGDRQLSLVLRSALIRTSSLADGDVDLHHQEIADLEFDAFAKAIADGLSFLKERGFRRPKSPLQIIETPMRHNLALALEQVVLVSDRAFRVTPIERIQRFHGHEILRAVYTHYFMKEYRFPPETAQVLGVWLRDRYVQERFRGKDDAYDVIGFWRFIPVIDAMLISPDLSFASSYFRKLSAPDPHRYQYFGDFVPKLGGTLLYEKLVDRLGNEKIAELLAQVLKNSSLKDEIAKILGKDFYPAWSGEYPRLQYRLGEITTHGLEAHIQIIREGEVASEPITVQLEDIEGNRHRIRAPESYEPLRIVTTTLSAPLALVQLDPEGRLIESPTKMRPSPPWDNRSTPQWNMLLNNFSLLISATDAAFASSVDLGFYREHDLHWRFALAAGVQPEALRLSGRGSYGFGRRVHPGRLQQWIGTMIFADHLREGFGTAMATGQGLGASLYYGFDDRRSYWAPGAGRGLRASVTYRRRLGSESGLNVDDDTLAFSLRGVQQWQFDLQHILALKTALDFYAWGSPMPQTLFAVGGRHALRGFGIDTNLGRIRGLVSAEWLHPLFRDLDFNAFYLAWLNAVDGAFFIDGAVLLDRWELLEKNLSEYLYADIGYGLKFYFDWLGVLPGLVTIDVGWPMTQKRLQFWGNSPSVYLGFTQSFFAF